jgi:phenylalanyl-tRNA synthetase beta chain
MKISEMWLREWADPDLDTTRLTEQLTMLGLEVDSVEPVSEGLAGVVVGQVTDVRPHPEADRLSLCQVDIGEAGSISVVCGAPNVRLRGRYPTALVGAALPGELHIAETDIRGETSEGMLCSAAELGLAESSAGILELGPEAELGTPVDAFLGLDDHIIDVDLTPNRADCFCVVGIARDLAAAQQLDYQEPEFAAVLPTVEDSIHIELADPAGCSRFAGRVIRDIDPDAQTPLWMREKLRRSGLRPIHPVVDVTNYVMVELGQPMHAYDLERLDGGIVVRRGRAGEGLTLLDEQRIDLADELLVITDDSGPIGLAGIMGGHSTAVSAGSRHIFLEAAFFAPEAIAGRARRFGLHTDASLRFERGVDPANPSRAIERATALLLGITGGTPGPVIDTVARRSLPSRPAVRLRRRRLDQVLGTTVPESEVLRIFRGLQMSIEEDQDAWLVTPPMARFDIGMEADLIEEVARLFGYGSIPETPGELTSQLGAMTEQRVSVERMSIALVDRGYQEAITYSFIEPQLEQLLSGHADHIDLQNPISAEFAVMRNSLWPGLLQAARWNLSRQNHRVRIFESGVRFLGQDADIIEEEVISALAIGGLEPEQWGIDSRSADLFDIKADLEALISLTGRSDKFEYRAASHPALRPGRAAEVVRSQRVVGWLGELHPAIAKQLDLPAAPVLFELAIEAAMSARPPAYEGISRFPAVRRDIAVVVPRAVPAAELDDAVREAAGACLRETVMFDVYTGDKIETGSKSVALGLILQDTSRTLTDAEVDGVMVAVIERLSRDFNATIRE